ncbi:MAG: hypothetical protein KAI25_15955 [Hyphomicrobiaceae bacterium]|nr:hypothetical protein [Hyphomicrobiaceae bacterium]
MSAPTGNDAVDAALETLEPMVARAQINRALRRAQAAYDRYEEEGGLTAARAFVSRLNLTISDRRYDDLYVVPSRRLG